MICIIICFPVIIARVCFTSSSSIIRRFSSLQSPIFGFTDNNIIILIPTCYILQLMIDISILRCYLTLWVTSKPDTIPCSLPCIIHRSDFFNFRITYSICRLCFRCRQLHSLKTYSLWTKACEHRYGKYK